MNKLVELFCDVDDFCNVFIPQWQQQWVTKPAQHGQQTSGATITCVSSSRNVSKVRLLPAWPGCAPRIFVCLFELGLLREDLSLRFLSGSSDDGGLRSYWMRQPIALLNQPCAPKPLGVRHLLAQDSSQQVG
ncbi:hypothetical protein Q4519_17300 [Motilimonas sp. 1_MG-2023]|nr:hypothetical protein [Motilimonas sp. 1_MG-2023]MDO6527439.1 hypothetical protein [Motilimonas sp. 1_MG-2023]